MDKSTTSCQHDWELQAFWSNPSYEGVRRYKCSKCSIWAWRQGKRASNKQEYTIYEGPITEPKKEWRDIRHTSEWDSTIISATRPDYSEKDDPIIHKGNFKSRRRTIN